MHKLIEKRYYNDNGDWLNVLWDTANIVQMGKVLICDHEGHSEVDIEWVIHETRAKLIQSENKHA